MKKYKLIKVEAHVHEAFKQQAEKQRRPLTVQMEDNAIKLGLLKDK